MSTPGLGRLPAPDSRDRAHLMEMVLPSMEQPGALRMMLRRAVGKIWNCAQWYDQKSYSCCVGFGWKHFLCAAPIMHKGPPDGFEIYQACLPLDEWADNDHDSVEMQFGTSVRAGAKALQAMGHLERYLWAFDMETVKQFVLTQGPVVLGTSWHDGMWKPDKNQYVNLTGGVVGGHCYTTLGYSRLRDAFRCINSHEGNRRFWLRAADLQVLLGDWGEACAAIQKKL